MKKLQISEPNIIEIALKNEILRSKEARYNHKLHGLLLICRGYTTYEVAQMFGQNPTTIQRWINKFEKNGFSALEESEKPGRPYRLDPSQLKIINTDLRKSPRDFGYDQNLWDGKLLSHHIKHALDVPLGVRQCQRLFHQLGFRLRKPRPILAHADQAAQEAFKKTPKVGANKQ